jgi:hypothetical protein
MDRRDFIKISLGTSFGLFSGYVPKIASEENKVQLFSEMMFDTKVWRDINNKVHRMEFSDGTVIGYQKNGLTWTKYPDGTKIMFVGFKAYQKIDPNGVKNSILPRSLVQKYYNNLKKNVL